MKTQPHTHIYILLSVRIFEMCRDSIYIYIYNLEYSNYCQDLYFYMHIVSANVFYGLLQILDETDCISHSANTLGKDMNPSSYG